MRYKEFRIWGWLTQFVAAISLVVLMSGIAAAYTISGTVANTSGKSGRIYLSLSGNNGDMGQGVSIPAAGTFTINGVQPGTYTVKAFMDTQGTGIQHANDPFVQMNSVVVSSGDVSTGTITLTTPPSVPVQAIQEVMVYGGTGGNVVLWNGPSDNNNMPIADKYTVSWSANSSGTPLAGSKDTLSGSKDFFVHTDGISTLYYQVTAFVGATSASTAWIPVASTSGQDVSGTVSFSGLTVSPSTPLIVALVDFSGAPPMFKIAAVTSASSGSASYTVNNVPAGTYTVYPYLDLNNNGAYDTGDVGLRDNDDFGTTATVAGAPVIVPNIDLTPNNVNALAQVTTTHGKNEWGEWYNLNVDVTQFKKQVVNVRITGGPQLSVPVDLAHNPWGNERFGTYFNVSKPTVGDTYAMLVTYSTGETETLNASVTAVLDGLATPLAPVNYIVYEPTPIFSWTPPSSPPAEYIYNIWVNENNAGTIWDAWGLPSTQTSILYASQGDVYKDVLTNGTTYNWGITITDRNGNQAQKQVSFTPTTLPAINSFTPRGGLAGTPVTISGVNFNINPASNTVMFNGVPATVSAATTTSLTVTVPIGATTGTIQLGSTTSTKDFIVAAPIQIRGLLKNSAGTVAIEGARIEKSDDETIYTFTDVNGAYTLNWFSGVSISLKITKNSFAPTYTTYYSSNSDLDLTAYPSHLYSPAELAAWGVSAGKGVIVGMVLGTNTTPYQSVSNAVVTARSNQSSLYYPVDYYNNGSFGGSGTYSNGLFFVRNVNANDGVAVNASKTSWNFFGGPSFSVYADSVTESGVLGYASQPFITGFTPTTGKTGDSVTISGSSFSTVLSENVVKFNGTSDAAITAADAGSITVTVPSWATTGQISVTTAGGVANSGSIFTVQKTLTVNLPGTGSGTVTSTSGVSPVLSCASPATSCTALVNHGDTVTLSATETLGSTLSWSDACTDIGCTFIMSNDKTAVATFTVLPYLQNETTSSFYGSIKSALDKVKQGQIIRALDITMLDSGYTFNTGTEAFFHGGYHALTDSIPTDYTTLMKPLYIRSGRLTVDRLKVK